MTQRGYVKEEARECNYQQTGILNVMIKSHSNLIRKSSHANVPQAFMAKAKCQKEAQGRT